MTKEKQWRFVSNLNATDDGLNDAGIETFSADAVKSMIREVIQNSMDQGESDSQEPVLVELDLFNIEKEAFPGGEQFEGILSKCMESNAQDREVVKFFQQAVAIMEGVITVLRVSDYHTTGLVGAESGKRGLPWHSLVKSKGSSNKNITSGGSFGIGKSAPFACSDLRTVFYASKVDEIHSYIGVSRLTSFQEDGITTIGTGFFSETDELNAILEPMTLGGFQRIENGTDIFILGFEKEADLEQVIKESVLTNFFISIWKNKLIVKYKGLDINKDTLGQYIASLDDKVFFDLKKYYELLSLAKFKDESITVIELENKEFGKKYGIKDKEATLLLMKDEDLNRRILMTRQAGMSLFEQGNISGNISFTGILLITGEAMNELFKAMEMPAHDAWEPKRCKVDKQKYIKAYEELRRYLRMKVKENFGETKENMIIAYGMEEFFQGGSSEGKSVETSILEGKVKSEAHKKQSRKQKPKEAKVTDVFGDIGVNGESEADKPKEKPEKKEDKKERKKPKYKYVDMKKRLISTNQETGEYVLKFSVPKKRKAIKLEVIGIGEQGNYPLNIERVVERSNCAKECSCKGNSIVLKNIAGKSNVELQFIMEFKKKCMMEVNGYEA